MPRHDALVLATRVLAVLAVHPDGIVTTERLGEHAGANPVVIRRLLGRLRQDGLVETRNGPGGGCALAREPERVTLGRIYRALRTDGDAAPEGTGIDGAVAAAEAAYVAELDRTSLAQIMAAEGPQGPSDRDPDS